MDVTRLFDLLDNYQEKYADNKVVLAGKVNHQWVKYDIEAYRERVNAISYALMAKGVEPGHKVGVISTNRPEWNFFDMAIMQIGAVSVPIYPTISDNDYLHILNHAEIEYVFVDTPDLVKRIKPIVAKVPHFKGIICLDTVEDTILLNDFYAFGNSNPQPEALAARKAAIKPDDLATMIYTSGTTGLPKGVMLSHHNIVSQLHSLKDTPSPWSRIALSFLPLCHAYERVLVYLYH